MAFLPSLGIWDMGSGGRSRATWDLESAVDHSHLSLQPPLQRMLHLLFELAGRSARPHSCVPDAEGQGAAVHLPLLPGSTYF